MKHIRAKFVTPSSADAAYTSYGWESVWNHKTRTVDGDVVKFGAVTDLQSIEVMPDGKCLILASERNIKKIKALIEAGQMVLARGEILEPDTFVPAKSADEVWPDAPTMAGDAPVDTDYVATPAKRGRPKRSPVELFPDKE